MIFITFKKVVVHVFVFVLFFFANHTNAKTTIQYNAPLEKNDTQKDYFIVLLKEVCKTLQQLNSSCELVPIDLPMLQHRQLKSLDKGLIDIVWTVTTKERESNYLPIKIPLMNGLIGYRIAVVNKNHADLFTTNYKLNLIKGLRVAQGHDWPDTAILRDNGFNVIETSSYETLYKDTSAGLFDYTLRGVLEVYSEFEKFNQSNVFIDKNLLFKYPSAIYFFVNKDNYILAKKISKALLHLKNTGKFDTLLTEFKNHKLALAQANFDRRIAIELHNKNINIPPVTMPLLPPVTMPLQRGVNSKGYHE